MHAEGRECCSTRSAIKFCEICFHHISHSPTPFYPQNFMLFLSKRKSKTRRNNFLKKHKLNDKKKKDNSDPEVVRVTSHCLIYLKSHYMRGNRCWHWVPENPKLDRPETQGKTNTVVLLMEYSTKLTSKNTLIYSWISALLSHHHRCFLPQ